MVFRNNFGIITLNADGDEYIVSHSLVTLSDDGSGDVFTKHEVTTARTGLEAPRLRTA
jgi:hypothetical protein